MNNTLKEINSKNKKKKIYILFPFTIFFFNFYIIKNKNERFL